MVIKTFQCARHSLVSVIGPTMVGQEKKFQGNGSQLAGKRYIDTGFANTIAIPVTACSFNCCTSII